MDFHRIQQIQKERLVLVSTLGKFCKELLGSNERMIKEYLNASQSLNEIMKSNENIKALKYFIHSIAEDFNNFNKICVSSMAMLKTTEKLIENSIDLIYLDENEYFKAIKSPDFKKENVKVFTRRAKKTANMTSKKYFDDLSQFFNQFLKFSFNNTKENNKSMTKSEIFSNFNITENRSRAKPLKSIFESALHESNPSHFSQISIKKRSRSSEISTQHFYR